MFRNISKNIFKISSYIQKNTKTPNPIFKITTCNTKHTPKMPKYIWNVRKTKNWKSTITKFSFHYISDFHNYYFVNFVSFIYFVYFVFTYIYIYIYIYTYPCRSLYHAMLSVSPLYLCVSFPSCKKLRSQGRRGSLATSGPQSASFVFVARPRCWGYLRPYRLTLGSHPAVTHWSSSKMRTVLLFCKMILGIASVFLSSVSRYGRECWSISCLLGFVD